MLGAEEMLKMLGLLQVEGTRQYLTAAWLHMWIKGLARRAALIAASPA